MELPLIEVEVLEIEEHHLITYIRVTLIGKSLKLVGDSNFFERIPIRDLELMMKMK
ncbi:hypothetical protein UF75_3163 [Desulfosporosinus sp. I2]|nr:hypothetical protein UF75_3163 [Desulfosporosinus sp. I2]